uniref:Uncharacterized protein n=1 Tax=Macaca nemestrina TaxID=9545 RepID=A0A2K6BPV5_MACNE
MASEISESSGTDCKGDPRNSANPLLWSLFIINRIEYCEYMPDVKNFPKELAKLTVENSPKQETGISEGQGTAGEEEEKKKQKRGGRRQIKQKKTVPQKVTIAQIPRCVALQFLKLILKKHKDFLLKNSPVLPQ